MTVARNTRHCETHRAHLVDEFLQNKDIHRMDWPVKSPKLIGIEHAWEALRRAIATHKPTTRTVQDC
ncbi:hypothetical protein TNCV_1427271 [Trichonephila clavipes]|nr:hypothetical protein TNCV_1427271 [Trichonephila clavipes]